MCIDMGMGKGMDMGEEVNAILSHDGVHVHMYLHIFMLHVMLWYLEIGNALDQQ
jgi:hypothetical protein